MLVVCGAGALILQDPSPKPQSGKPQPGPDFDYKQMLRTPQYKLCVAAVALSAPAVLLFSPEIFKIATERGLTIMSHAEDREISPWDYRLAENIETVRNCHLAEYYGTRLHMCHVSTRESVDAVRMSRMRGARVSCEVTPHHLWFDDSRLTYRVNPPIRKADDVTALIDAIKDGTVTCIGTDHAPHTAEEKEKGAAGMVGLETAFGVCYTKLCREQRLPLEMLSFLMSAGPAAVLGLADRKGMLEPGYDADIVLVDLDHMYEVHADELHSKSKNCPYDGALLYGKVVTTIKGGKVTFQIEE